MLLVMAEMAHLMWEYEKVFSNQRTIRFQSFMDKLDLAINVKVFTWSHLGEDGTIAITASSLNTHQQHEIKWRKNQKLFPPNESYKILRAAFTWLLESTPKTMLTHRCFAPCVRLEVELSIID